MEYHISNNCLWIEISKDVSYEEAVKYNGKYVIIEGVFDAENKGNFGMFPGAIVNITRYDLWEDRF